MSHPFLYLLAGPRGRSVRIHLSTIGRGIRCQPTLVKESEIISLS